MTSISGAFSFGLLPCPAAIRHHCRVNLFRASWFGLLTLCVAAVSGAESGPVKSPADGPNTVVLTVDRWPTGGIFPLASVPHGIVGVTGLHNGKPVVFDWTILTNGIRLETRDRRTKVKPEEIILERAETSGQIPGGRIAFVPKEAKLAGEHLKLDTSANADAITGWTTKADAATWDYKPSRWGKYDLEVAYSADGRDPVEFNLIVAGQTFPLSLHAAGKSVRNHTASAGRFYLAKSDPYSVRLELVGDAGKTKVQINGIILRPAPEGDVPTQAPSGEILLLSSLATTHSVMMRYEPATNKNCLGYWVDPADWAEWSFPVAKAGDYEVEVWQGCGKGNGGSDVLVEVAGQKFAFVVQDTGHFQAFVPRKLGRIHLVDGLDYSLAIHPQRKQGAAVMDVRQVKLIPVGPETK